MGHQSQDVVMPSGTGASGASKSTSARGTRQARSDVTVKSIRLEGEDRQRLIAEAAYFRAEQRGFTPGNELEDWLAAESEI